MPKKRKRKRKSRKITVTVPKGMKKSTVIKEKKRSKSNPFYISAGGKKRAVTLSFGKREQTEK